MLKRLGLDKTGNPCYNTSMKNKPAAKTAAPKYSPLPWSISSDPSNPNPRIIDRDHNLIGVVASGTDAALIVRRVNQGRAFDAMKAVLDKMAAESDMSNFAKLIEKAEAALRLAQDAGT